MIVEYPIEVPPAPRLIASNIAMTRASALRVAGAPVHPLYDTTLALLEAVRLPARASDADVHTARKQMKRIRAALRLLRPALGTAAYRSANRRVRDAAKLLAPTRDARSLISTVELLEKQSRSREADLYLHRLKRQLLTVRAASRARLMRRFSREGADLLLGAVALLRKMPARRREPFSAIKGLRHVYREGRRALKRVRRQPTSQSFHEWRKQTKYLANQATLVFLPYRLKVKGLRRRTEKLAQALGVRHDLDFALAKMSDTPTRRRLGPLPGRVAKNISKRRKKLTRRALVLGSRLYRQKPLKFAKRLERKFRRYCEPDTGRANAPSSLLRSRPRMVLAGEPQKPGQHEPGGECHGEDRPRRFSGKVAPAD
jgi:hypothetical protein